jgi:hypothetical protein
MADISLEGMSSEAIQGLAQLAKGLSDDPKTRGRMLALVKERDPTMSIPEIDIPEQFNTLLATERDARVKIENKMRDDDIRREVREKRDTIMGRGISAAEVVEVEKLMTERGIINHDTAAEFYLAQKQMAVPTPPAHLSYQPLELPKFDLTKGNVRTQGKALAAEMLSGIRSGKVSI